MPTEKYQYRSPLGVLYLTLDNGRVASLEYESREPASFAAGLPADTALHQWLDAYFNGDGAAAAPPLLIQGTPFQRRVWQALLDIPGGQTRTYGDIAAVLGSAARAVGQACRRNPLPLFVPCHRVVGRQSVGGYEGATSGRRLDRKNWLLQHEKNHTTIA